MDESGHDGGTDERMRALYPGLRRFAAVVGPLETDPDDLVQEALVRLFASPSSPDVRDVDGYLRRTIVNLASNERRRLGRARRARDQVTPEVGVLPEYPSDVSDLDQVDPTTRALLFLVVVEGASIADAAATVGCSPVAARARLSRGRRRLRSLIEGERANG